MLWIKYLLSAVGIGAAAWLALVLVRFNRKRLRIIRSAAAATNEQLEEIYRLVEAGSTEKTQGFVLGRLNGAADDVSCILTIPGELEGFPWAGMSVAVDAGKEVHFRFLNVSTPKTQLLGQKYRPVSVPRVRLKSGKLRNQFFPSKYVKRSEELRQKLVGICAEHPTELLSYLLCVGIASFEFEPINQARIGTSAAWVQDPEFQYCDQCNKKMVLILQLPGTLLHKRAFREGTFYFFGCKRHADQTRTVVQFS